MKTHTLEAGQFVDFILKHEDDVNCENTIFSTTALTQRRWVRITWSNEYFFRVYWQLLKLQLPMQRSYLQQRSSSSCIIIVIVIVIIIIIIYLFIYLFTLTVLHFFWCFLAKRCCTKWAWDAGNLGLLILVLIHCTCTTAGSIEKVATRTVN